MVPPPPPPPPGHAPACGAVGFPVFQGEGTELTQRAVDDFPWVDFKRGSGSFAVEGGRSEWKPIGSGCKDGVAVSMHARRLQDKGGLSEFLIRGSLPISRDSYFVLNADMEHRAEWDDSTTSVAELSAAGPGPEAGPLARRERVLHWRVKYPWPLGKREYVLEQGVHTLQEEGGDTVRCIQGRTLAKARGEAVRPPVPGTMRVEDYRSNMVIWAGPGGSGANFALLYFEDSKVASLMAGLQGCGVHHPGAAGQQRKGGGGVPAAPHRGGGARRARPAPSRHDTSPRRAAAPRRRRPPAAGPRPWPPPRPPCGCACGSPAPGFLQPRW
ncbi:unnamed protein product [Prorocentrum cordatum]|uniref:START domain-containing protein n=1 Tax=Prorocentrum cordatum TaxID=2364126 RepID=A0ABN9Q337_9DINO|nr:unnamed protein product [Polarella glacialis]